MAKRASRTSTSTRAAKRTAEERKKERDLKRDLIARGLCRQCGKSRGKSPSASRCLRCLRKDRETKRKAGGHVPYKPGATRGGRPPLSLQERLERFAHDLTHRE